MNTVNWGIIGCGDVCEVKSGPAFNNIANSQLIAVMRRDNELAKDFAYRHNVPKYYDNAEELIADPEINAVYIATPPNTHAKYSIMALQQQKHVYVEKPMALSTTDCEQMITTARENKVSLFVAYYRRALPDFLRVKKLIDSGEIGDVKFVTIRLFKHWKGPILEKHELPWRFLPEIAGGGQFVDLASHQIDYLNFILGDVISAKAHVTNQAGLYPAEDFVSASLQYPNSVVVNGLWCFSVPENCDADEIEITGTKGKISFSTFGFTPIKLMKPEKTVSFKAEKPKHVQQYLIQNIVDELLGKGKSPSNGETGIHATRIIEEILKEYYS